MVITGNVIADGIKGPGYTFEQAQEFIEDFKPTTSIGLPNSIALTGATWLFENRLSRISGSTSDSFCMVGRKIVTSARGLLSKAGP